MLEMRAMIDKARGMMAIIVIIIFTVVNSPNYSFLYLLYSDYNPFIMEKASLMVLITPKRFKNVLIIGSLFYPNVKIIQYRAKTYIIN